MTYLTFHSWERNNSQGHKSSTLILRVLFFWLLVVLLFYVALCDNLTADWRLTHTECAVKEACCQK